MKTKIIPFDLKTAKKIQSGEIKGKIVRRGAQKQVCEILEFYATWQTHCEEKFLIVKVPAHDFEREQLWIYHQDGRAHHNAYPEMWYDLVLEVPDEPQFKPFDQVLVRSEWLGHKDIWHAAYYSHFQVEKDTVYHVTTAGTFCIKEDIIPYKGNEHLLGTTNNPKED